MHRLLETILYATLATLSVEAIDPAYAKNITVFHVNPDSFDAPPINMDTADLLGDMYFDLRGVITPLECAHASPSTAHDCDNPEVTSDDLVITKLTLEVDRRFGSYGRCNICVNHTDHHGHTNCSDGSYVCSCGSYGRSEPCGAAVGLENITQTHRNRRCDADEPDWECWRTVVAKKTGGCWYSTTDAGYCGSHPTPDCTWRVVEVVKVVNKTCSDNAIYSTVEKEGQSCFARCSGTGIARNTSSECWIRCFFTTVLGPDSDKPGGSITGMPLADLEAAWNLPFSSSDPKQGGCPNLVDLSHGLPH